MGGKRTKTRKTDVLQHPFVKKATMDLRIRNLVYGIKDSVIWKRAQFGGGTEIAIGPHIFTYEDITEGKERTVICIAKQKGICFRINFAPDEKTISLDIGFYPNCSAPIPLDKASGVMPMLEAIMTIIFKSKDILMYDKITLTDNSYVDCRAFDDGRLITIDLMDMYYLTSGCTWYSSLIPMFLMDMDLDHHFLKHRQNIVGESAYSYNKFMSKLSPDVVKALAIIPQPTDPNAPGSASQFLKQIKEDQTHCVFFRRYRSEFYKGFDATYFVSLHGTQWCAALDNGRLLAPTTLHCMHEKHGIVAKPPLLKTVSDAVYDVEKKKRQIPSVFPAAGPVVLAVKLE
jgi:hypothetical protein